VFLGVVIDNEVLLCRYFFCLDAAVDLSDPPEGMSVVRFGEVSTLYSEMAQCVWETVRAGRHTENQQLGWDCLESELALNVMTHLILPRRTLKIASDLAFAGLGLSRNVRGDVLEEPALNKSVRSVKLKYAGTT
jgi:hypothetical protein